MNEKIDKKFKNLESESQDWIQDTLSVKADLDNIGRLETGNTNPRIRTFYKSSQALKVKLKELVDIK